jgi:prepilin-type N-terminal cleavage/methylation domain-containing protein
MKGFSLIEMLVVLAIIGIIGSISVVTFNTMRKVGDAKHAAYVYVDSLKEAKNMAKMMKYDTNWGVKVNESDTVVFNGPSYSGRESAHDSQYVIPSNLNISGVTEIVFSKFTGLPDVFGTTTFSNDFGTSSVYISGEGAVSY